MSGKTTHVKFVLMLALLVALALFAGSDPWGPI
jgi:hypothetical protein